MSATDHDRTDAPRASDTPCADVLLGLHGVAVADLALVELLIRLSIRGAATEPETLDVAVGNGAISVTPRDRRTDRAEEPEPDVLVTMTYRDFEDWRHGRRTLLDCLVGDASVKGHWIDLLCAHGLSQLPVVQRVLAADPLTT